MEVQDILNEYIGIKDIVNIILDYTKPTLIYAGSSNKFGIKVYNYDDGKYVEEYVFPDRLQNIANITATSKDSLIFISEFGNIGRLNIKTGAVIIKNNISTGGRSVHNIDFNQLIVSSNNNIVTLDSIDRVQIWDFNTLNVIGQLRSPSFKTRAAFMKIIDGLLWIIDTSGELNIWNLNTQTLVEASRIPIIRPVILELSVDQSLIIYVDPISWDIILFDIKTRNNIRTCRGHGEITKVLPISQNLICILTIRGRLIIANINDDTFTDVYRSNTISAIKLLSNGNILISDMNQIKELNPITSIVKTITVTNGIRDLIALE